MKAVLEKVIWFIMNQYVYTKDEVTNVRSQILILNIQFGKKAKVNLNAQKTRNSNLPKFKMNQALECLPKRDAQRLCRGYVNGASALFERVYRVLTTQELVY